MTRRNAIFLALIVSLALVLSPAVAAKKAEKPVDLKGFKEFVVRTMAEWEVPGMAVSIVKDGKVIFAEGFGLRDVKQGLKVTPHTLFPIGSCSKAFTAAGMGIVVDDGKVAWDEPVRTYLPDFKLQDRPRTPAATLDRARAIALETGLKFVYVGNVHSPEGQSTRCPGCGGLLIARDWHSVLTNRLRNGACPDCGRVLPGRFTRALAA